MTECKTGLKECEVLLQFRIPKDKLDRFYEARTILNDLGIKFDSGGDSNGDECVIDWEFDWSLKGPIKVFFKRFKE